jgi:hypothetical protein
MSDNTPWNSPLLSVKQPFRKHHFVNRGLRLSAKSRPIPCVKTRPLHEQRELGRKVTEFPLFCAEEAIGISKQGQSDLLLPKRISALFPLAVAQ